MIKVKVFTNEIEKINEFLSTVKVIDVKYQMTDDNDCFMVIYDDNMSSLSKIPTCKLVDELKKRSGVITHKIAPHTEVYRISTISTKTGKIETLNKPHVGPAVILEVID